MDDVALTAVLSSAVIGAGGLAVTVWGSRRNEYRDDQVRRQDRLADTYVAVLDLAEREGHWVRSVAVWLEWLTDEPYTAKPIVAERPTLRDRTTVEARLLAFGTRSVIAAHITWRTAITDLEAERTNIDWNVSQDGRDPNEPLARSHIETFLKLLAPQERARQDLIDAVAKDLNSR